MNPRYSPALPRALTLAVYAGVLLALAGCETTTTRRYDFAHPQFAEKRAEAPVAVMPPPEITINRVTAGGLKEKDGDASNLAVASLTRSLSASAFAGSDEPIRPAKNVPDALKPDLEEAIALSHKVGDTIVSTLFGLERGFYLHKRADFRYSIGDCSAILDALEGDTLLLINGYEQYGTAGRATLNFLKSVAVAAASGGNTSEIYSDRATFVTAMLVDRSGDVLWFSYLDPMMGSINTLRTDEKIYEVTARFLKDYQAAASQ